MSSVFQKYLYLLDMYEGFSVLIVHMPQIFAVVVNHCSTTQNEIDFVQFL